MWREEDNGGLAWYRFEALSTGVDALVTTRHGGQSSAPYAELNLGFRVGDDPDLVLQNRKRVFDAVGWDLGRSTWCRQVHADNVVVVDQTDAGRGALSEANIVPDADALVTGASELALCVTLADCVPVVIYDPVRHVLGLAHAGWGGTVSRIASRTVDVMRERFGVEPSKLVVGIGPSIGPERYEVGQEVIERANETFGDQAHEVIGPISQGGKATFDLWTANQLDLESAGVKPSRIEIAGISTDEHLDEFYSHRVEGGTGRFIAAASLRPQR